MSPLCITSGLTCSRRRTKCRHSLRHDVIATVSVINPNNIISVSYRVSDVSGIGDTELPLSLRVLLGEDIYGPLQAHNSLVSRYKSFTYNSQVLVHLTPAPSTKSTFKISFLICYLTHKSYNSIPPDIISHLTSNDRLTQNSRAIPQPI
jgi:hypothetical protein